MKRQRRSRAAASVALVLSTLAVAAALALAACGDSSSVALTEAALPTWAPGASPSPALTVTDQTGTVVAGFEVSVDAWPFTPRVDIEVSALGYFDGSQDGLQSSHKVAIFDEASEELLVIAEVGPSSSLDGAFRWETVEPIVLEPGKSYLLAGEYPKPFDAAVHDSGVWAPELRHGQFRSVVGSWQYPKARVPEDWVVPNFKFKPVSAASPTP